MPYPSRRPSDYRHCPALARTESSIASLLSEPDSQPSTEMGGVLSFLLAYVLGGLTLLPLLTLALCAWPFLFSVRTTASQHRMLTLLTSSLPAYELSDIYVSAPFGDPDPAKLVKSAIASEQPASPAPGSTAAEGEGAAKQPPSKGLPPRYGWLTVRKSFKPRAEQVKDGAAGAGGVGGSAASGSSEPSSPSTASTYSSLLLRSVRPNGSKDVVGGSAAKDGASATQPALSYVPPPEFFYAALKGSILYLYTSEALDECHAVLDLQQHDVTFYPVDGLLDGELYAKRNAIHLKPRKTESAGSSPVGGQSGTSTAAAAELDSPAGATRGRSPVSSLLHPSAWFIFVQSNIEMEECVRLDRWAPSRLRCCCASTGN